MPTLISTILAGLGQDTTLQNINTALQTLKNNAVVGPSGAIQTPVVLGSVSGAVTCNLTLGSVFTATITGDTTFTFANWPVGKEAEPVIYVTEDVTGGHAITIASVTWLPSGTAPTFVTTAGSMNIVTVASPDGGAHIYGATGGASLTGTSGQFAEVLGPVAISSASYTAGSPALPSLTATSAGLYEISFGTTVVLGTGAGTAIMSPSLGGVAPADNDSILLATGASTSGSIARTLRKTLTANAVVAVQANCVAGVNLYRNWLVLKAVL